MGTIASRAESGMGVIRETHGREVPGAAARSPDLRAYIYLGVMVVLGSTTSPLAQVAVRQLPVGMVPLLRFGIAGLCLAPFAGGFGAVAQVIRSDWRRLTIAAACCVPINQFFFLTAAKLGTNAHVGLFYATVPLVVWGLAWAIGQEALDLRRLGGILVSIAGVLVIGLGNLLGADGAHGPAETRAVATADFLLIFAVISWGAFVTFSRPLAVRHGALPTLAATFLVGFLLQLPVASLTVPDWAAQIHSARADAWICLGVLAVLMTPTTMGLQNLALRRLDASAVAAFSNVSPVLTVVWGVWLFHEALTPALVVGGALTLAGVFWTSRPSARKVKAVTPPRLT